MAGLPEQRERAASAAVEEATPVPGAGTTGRELLSVSAAARMLGVSPSSLRAWAAAGRVPHVRTPGGHRRFEREELVRWLAERGGEPPAATPRTAELVPSRIASMPDVAQTLRTRRDEMVGVFEEELARCRPSGALRASSARQSRVLGTVEAIAEGVERGDLAVCLREAEWEGFRHGAAGNPGDAPVTEALALRRAVDRVLGPVLGTDGDRRRSLERSMDRMAVRVAAGYAEGVRVRLRAGAE
jgi:excisionase family DNA binding protein